MKYDLNELKPATQDDTYYHPDCDGILLTDSPQGFNAIRDSDIMAVIWQRDLSAELQESAKILFQQYGADELFEQFASRSRSRTPLVFEERNGLKRREEYTADSLREQIGECLYEDMNFLTQSFSSAIRQGNVGARLSIRGKSMPVPDKHDDLFKLHIDQGIKARLHTVYEGAAMHYVPQRVRYGEGRALREQYKNGRLHTCQFNAGDAVVFKGGKSPARRGTLSGGLMHFEKLVAGENRMAFISSYAR